MNVTINLTFHLQLLQLPFFPWVALRNFFQRNQLMAQFRFQYIHRIILGRYKYWQAIFHHLQNHKDQAVSHLVVTMIFFTASEIPWSKLRRNIVYYFVLHRAANCLFIENALYPFFVANINDWLWFKLGFGAKLNTNNFLCSDHSLRLRLHCVVVRGNMFSFVLYKILSPTQFAYLIGNWGKSREGIRFDLPTMLNLFVLISNTSNCS